MKNKGFTLLELLGVVIILGALSLITFPIILNQIKNAKQGIKDSTKALIIDAAKDYYEDNSNNYDRVEGMTYCIDIETLTDENYLNKNLKDENLNNMDTSEKVKMFYHNDKFNYDIVDKCINNSLSRNNIEVPIVTEDLGLYKSTTDQDRFIYRGGNPINNWIELNEGTEETPDYVKYRIISFETDGTIKVIRDNSIGAYAWDKRTSTTEGPRKNENNTYCNYAGTYFGCNVWGTQESTYYNDTTLTNLNQEFFYKYYPNNTTQTLQNFKNTGTVTQNSSLNDYLNTEWAPAQALNKYIVEHSFNVGGIYYTTSYTGGDKGIFRELEEQNSYTWNGKIGLMNITEYVEASLNPTCTSVYSNYYYNTNYLKNSTQTLTKYDDWPCSNRSYNWMPKAITDWSLSPNSHNFNNVWYVSSSGNFSGGYSSFTYGVRPSFYLKPDISLAGEGSEENPYRIVGES